MASAIHSTGAPNASGEKKDDTLHIETRPTDAETRPTDANTGPSHANMSGRTDYQLTDGTKATQYAEGQLKSDLDTLSTWQAIKTFKRAFIVCAIGAFSAVTDGYQFQASGAIVANLGFRWQFSTPQGGSTILPRWVLAFNGIFSAGQVIGQFSAQWVAEWFGRRWAVFTIMGVQTIAAIIEAVAPSPGIWTLGKFVAGIGIGAVQATLPVYINEHAPSQIRGFLVVSYSLWWNVGSLIASVVLKARADVAPYDYRTVIYTQFGVIAFSTLIFVFMPESPWWTARKGDLDRTRKILKLTHGDVVGYNVEREIGIMLHTIEVQRENDAATAALGFFAVLRGLNLKRFLIGSYPKVLQQFVGLAVFSSNAAYFFQIAGNTDPFLVTVIIGSVGIGAVVFDALLVDKLGRRFMTLTGFGGACCGIILIAIVGCFDYPNRQELGALLVLGGTVANFFNTFQSSTSYAYLTEMPEQRFKARACGWGLAYCNLYAVLINFTLPLMLDAWDVRATFFFVALGVPGTVLAFFIMPESARRSPAEIHEMFVDHVPLRRWRKYKTSVERDLDTRLEVGA